MWKYGPYHCIKSVLIRIYSGPHFLAFGLNTERLLRSSPYSVRMRENADQNNSEYGYFSGSVCPAILVSMVSVFALIY